MMRDIEMRRNKDDKNKKISKDVNETAEGMTLDVDDAVGKLIKRHDTVGESFMLNSFARTTEREKKKRLESWLN